MTKSKKLMQLSSRLYSENNPSFKSRLNRFVFGCPKKLGYEWSL